MREGFRFALTYKAFFHQKIWLLFSTKQGISMSKPIDIDNRQFILYQRQKLIVKRLMKVSAEEIAPIIFHLAIENCNGCLTEHLYGGRELPFNISVKKLNKRKRNRIYYRQKRKTK
jgi:hypothetical protein